jgi:hypothetical protein
MAVMALVMIAFTLAAVFGVVLFAVACAWCLLPRFRRLALVTLVWGVAGAVASIQLFVSMMKVYDHAREPILSLVGGMFIAAGFGILGAIGSAIFLGAKGLRLPNRWADRRRQGPPPNQRLERP